MEKKYIYIKAIKREKKYIYIKAIKRWELILEKPKIHKGSKRQ